MFFRKDCYKVKLRGRSGVVYEEGGKTVQIEAEMLAGEIDMVIYFDSISSWQPPYENEAIPLDEKNRIKENVTVALKEKGLAIEWE
ncbi:MAG: hypothetical protein JSU67_03700 [Gammaproteobacteria bacterium]|nr:MAG: hypothetical protein JSU67_03700 [Gammaproteobacteria bacterium]